VLPARDAHAEATMNAKPDKQECLSCKSARPGDIVIVEITETHEYDLVGRVVEILDVPRPAAAQPAVTAPVQRVSTGAALRVLA